MAVSIMRDERFQYLEGPAPVLVIGKSTDTKPAVPENSTFEEIDTGKTYYYDGEDWTEKTEPSDDEEEAGGGAEDEGGGGGGSEDEGGGGAEEGSPET